MKTKITYIGSAAKLKHISGTKAETSGQDKNEDNSSGERNTPCILIFIKDRIISCKKLLAAAFNKLKFEYIKDTAVSDRCIFFIGRGIPVRTGEFPGSFRNSPGFSGSFPGLVRRIPEVLRSFSEVFRSFPGLFRSFPEVLRSFPDWLRKFPGSCRDFPGLFRQLSEEHREFPVLIRDFSGSFRVLSGLSRSFPGLYRSFPAESGERQRTIKNQFFV